LSYGNPQTPDHLPAGTVIAGRYKIIDVVGEGGFATVYRAEQMEIHREVALKLLNPAADMRTQQAFQERFRREARTAARIDHPNVVTVFDFGIAEEFGRPFMAMELLQGHDLEVELQDNGPMDAQRLVPLFAEALEALGDAHKQGIIHKDLKPSNLFLTNPGSRRETLKILDFGIARLADVQAGKGKLTGTGQILGTPQYLAPEYIQHQTATPALDVYQMALILVETLTGAPVVDYDNPYQCLMVHGSGKLEVPRSLVTGPLGPVLLQALELDYTARYPNATAFQEALADIDIDQIGVVPPGEIKHRISEVSGSLRSNADLGTADTGTFSQRDSGLLVQEGERVLADGSLAVGAHSADLRRPASGPVATPVSISGDYGEAKSGGGLKMGVLLAVAGLLLLAVLVGGGVAVWLGMDYSATGEATPTAAAPSGEAPAPTPPAPVAPEEVQEEPAAPAPKPVFVQVTAPPGATILKDGKELGTGTVTVEFASSEAAAVDLEFRGAEWTHKTVSVDPSKPVVAIDLAPAPVKAVARPKKARPPRKVANKRPAPAKRPKPVEKPKKKRPSMGFVE
jgi:eukaryotic-like serine/threonine-protein kinase